MGHRRSRQSQRSHRKVEDEGEEPLMGEALVGGEEECEVLLMGEALVGADMLAEDEATQCKDNAAAATASTTQPRQN